MTYILVLIIFATGQEIVLDEGFPTAFACEKAASGIHHSRYFTTECRQVDA